jgi:D-alanyl-D-alanine carboxypeptidase
VTSIDNYLHTVIDQGTTEARRGGSATVEAHHLLLAIAAERETGTHRILTSVGLDEGVLREALDREFEHSLNAVGVSLTPFDLPRPSGFSGRSPQLGASAKLALERGFASVSRKKDLRPAHLLLGIVQAEIGTVPRALALAGIDRTDLVTRLRQTLTGENA